MSQDYIEDLLVDANRKFMNDFSNFDDEINGYLRSMSNRMLFRIEDIFSYNRVPFNGGRVEDFLNENFCDEILKIYHRRMNNAIEMFGNGIVTLKNQIINANDVNSLNSCFVLNEQIHADFRVQSAINFERDFDYVSILRYSRVFPEEILYDIKSLFGRMMEDMEYELNSSIGSIVKKSYFNFDECLNEKKKLLNEENEKSNENFQEQNNSDTKYAPLDRINVIEGEINDPDAKIMLLSGEVMTLRQYLELFVLPYMDFERNVQISENEKIDLVTYFEKTLLPIEKEEEKASFR